MTIGKGDVGTAVAAVTSSQLRTRTDVGVGRGLRWSGLAIHHQHPAAGNLDPPDLRIAVFARWSKNVLVHPVIAAYRRIGRFLWLRRTAENRAWNAVDQVSTSSGQLKIFSRIEIGHQRRLPFPIILPGIHIGHHKALIVIGVALQCESDLPEVS